MPAKKPKPPQAPAHALEAQVLDGLKPFAERELKERFGSSLGLGASSDAEAVPFRFRGDLRRLRELRTVVAVYLVEQFAVPRPKALLGDQTFRRLLALLERVRQQDSFTSFRLNAAGRESSVMLRLTRALEEATGLRHDPEEGNLLLRLRPAGEGWEGLARLTPRPLSARSWRACNMEGGLNATVAAAMLSLLPPRKEDRVLNLMCGSGTLLLERLAQGPVQRLVGVDISERALTCSEANIAAAGALEQVELVRGDARGLELPTGSFDVILADAPWGDQVGSHRENAALYPALLKEAARLSSPGGHVILLTHEIRLLERLLPEQPDWSLKGSHRVYHGGHYPRIYLLKETLKHTTVP